MENLIRYRWALLALAVVAFGGILHRLSPPAVPPARPAIPAATVTFGEIQDARINMTSARWDAYSGRLRGQGTAGTGWVVGVTSGRGGYSVQLSPLPPLPAFPLATGIWVDGLSASGAAGLTKGQKVRYAGRIASAGKALGFLVIRLEPGEVTAAP
jgi:hypothetical protein